MKISLKLFSIITLGIIFVAWCFLLFAALGEQNRRQSALVEQFEEPLHAHARLLNQQFERAHESLERLHEDVEQLAYKLPITKERLALFHNVLKQQLRAHPKQYAHFMAFDSKNARIWFRRNKDTLHIVHKQDSYADAAPAYNASSNMRAERGAFSRSESRHWFIPAREKVVPYFVSAFENPHTREWVSSLAQGIYLQDKFQGVVGVYLRLADIAKPLERWGRGATGGFLLLNHETGGLLTTVGPVSGEMVDANIGGEDGFVARHERGHSNFYELEAQHAIDWKTLLAEPMQRYISVTGKGGDSYRLSTKRLTHAPLTLLVYQRADELPSAGLPGWFFVGSVLLLLLSLAWGWWFMQGIAYPVRQLLAVDNSLTNMDALLIASVAPEELHQLHSQLSSFETLYRQLEGKTLEAQQQLERLHTNLNEHLSNIAEKEDALDDVTERHQQTETQAQQFKTHLKQARKDIQKLKSYAQKTLVALQQSRAKTEAAEQAKFQFLANMSHELRTPLNAIIGYTEILQEDVEESGLEMMKPDLQKILGAGHHLLELINNLFDLSNLYMHRIELFPEHFDVMPMLEDVAATVQPLFERQGNVLKMEVGQALGSMYNDLPKVRQNLMHLLSNAGNFSEHGTIILSVHRAQEEGLGWLIFGVSDEGIGMSPEQTESIFELFPNQSQAYARSAGFSLALAQQFCQLMGGTIKVESQLGEGSEFTMRLPAEMQTLEEDTTA